ncbi:MAG: homoserine dehydrogenase [Kiritimatiellia bacterium]|jgi:homoserine dehydrogenase
MQNSNDSSPKSKRQIGVGILGFGTVGAGVAAGLLANHVPLAERTGIDIVLRKVADLDVTTDRGVALPEGVLTTDAMAVINDPGVDIVVELIGGCGVAKAFVKAALQAGKPVVTANKKLLAEHGAEIFGLAEEKNVDLFFGASVGGGIPIIRALRDGLAGNRIVSIHGILNGTCNYILTKMEREGVAFEAALAEAQRLGFAEADPTLDVDGFDTLHKAAILAALAYGIFPDVGRLPVRGIRGVVEATDFRFAAELGYKIKLLAIVKQDAEGVEIRVEPTLVPEDGMLASVSGVFNAALVKGDLADETFYHGRGAGRLPTASTVIGDIAEVARGMVADGWPRIALPRTSREVRVKDRGAITSRHYVRLSLADTAGSLAAAAGVFGDHHVSIQAALQKSMPGERDGFATVVVMTHKALQSDIDAALAAISTLPCCGAPPHRLGIEG